MTSIIETPWKDWEHILIHAMPNSSKPVKMDLAVKIDGHTVFKDQFGKLYSSRVKDGLSYSVSDWGFTASLMKGLVALDIITKKQMKEYIDAGAARAASRDARHSLDTFNRIITEYGIHVSARERNKLVKAAGITEAA